MVSRISYEQAACFWREAKACSVQVLASPPWHNFALSSQALERQSVLMRLGLQMFLEVLVGGELVVRHVMCPSQCCAQTMRIEAPFLGGTTIATVHELVLRQIHDHDLRGTEEPGA